MNALLNVDGSPSVHGNDYFNYTSNHSSYKDYLLTHQENDPFDNATILFDNNERFPKRSASYFRTVQPLNHHSRIPTKHIYCYSFALQPEKHQPTGTANFSRLHSCFLNLDNITTDPTELLVFAKNYNVLVINSGMAGLKYSN